jgi:flagellar motor component MotA
MVGSGLPLELLQVFHLFFKGTMANINRQHILGTDMAYAFLEQLVGRATANVIRGVVEVSVREHNDDEFAEFHGLV